MEELLKRISENHSQGTKLLNELVIRMKEPVPVQQKATDSEIADFLIQVGLEVRWNKSCFIAQSPKHNLTINKEFVTRLEEVTSNGWDFKDNLLIVNRNACPDELKSENSNNK